MSTEDNRKKDDSNTSYQPLGDQRAPDPTDPDYPRLCRCCPCDALPWLMLMCIMCLTFGSYWVFDTPGAIQNQLTKWFAPQDYTNSMNLNLYSVYSWPNCVLAFFGGFIVDRITGVRAGAIIFCALIFVGQILFAVGVSFKTYWVMIIGRFVFGLGGESLTVAQNTYTVRWFSGPSLAFAFGLVLAFARVGSSVNFIVTPKLAASGVPISVWFGACTCAFSLLACFVAAGIDKYGEKRHPAKAKPAGEEPVSISQVRHFPGSAWLLMLICLFFYICVLTFYTVASQIMQKTGNKYDDETATLFLSIPNFVSILMSPTFGFVLDKVGRALTAILIASVMMVGAHVGFLALALEWYLFSPVYVMIWLGFAYSMGAAAIWPILSVIIEEKMQGTAYGCMTAVQNAGLALFPMVIGFLQDSGGIKDTKLQYTLPIFIFIGCAGVSIILTFILIGVDRVQNKGIMNASADIRRAMKEAKAADSKKLLDAATLTSDSTTGLPHSPSLGDAPPDVDSDTRLAINGNGHGEAH